jgi:putative colanic acid biosynthesis acetyltransferase WcaF
MDFNFQNLSRYNTPSDFRGKSKIIVQFWWMCYTILFRPSPQKLYGWRRFLLRAFGAKIGKKVIIRPTAKITYPWKVSIGDYSWIGDDVILYSLGEIEIGSNSVISQRSYICTGSHDYTKETFDIFAKKIKIGNSCWLATDVFIAPGVSIGNGTIVGARSSVFKNLPSNKICTGSPINLIKARN